MAAAIDALTSPTLKHSARGVVGRRVHRVSRGDAEAAAGNRILDVGCGEGLGEVAIGRLHISQVRLVGVDLVVSKVLAAQQETASHNQRVNFAAADACRLPFRDGVFDSIYCVAVLQHVSDVETAVAEFARVTAPGAAWWPSSPTTARDTCSARRRPAGARSSCRAPFSARCPERSPMAARRPSARSCRAVFTSAASSRSTSGCFRVADVARSARCRRLGGTPERRGTRAWFGCLRCRALARPRVPGLLTTYEAEAKRQDRRSSRSRTRCCLRPSDRKSTRRVKQSRSPRGPGSLKPRKATKAGTTTRRSTTGRTRGRSAGATCRSGAISRCTAGGPVLELGCGTGRISLPLGRAGVPLVGDRSIGADARARAPAGRRATADSAACAWSEATSALPCRSPIRGRRILDGAGAVRASCSRCCASAIWRPRSPRCVACCEPGGTFGLELVADLPSWEEYRKRVSLKGWRDGPAART